jgi:hypothetical protein
LALMLWTKKPFSHNTERNFPSVAFRHLSYNAERSTHTKLRVAAHEAKMGHGARETLQTVDKVGPKDTAMSSLVFPKNSMSLSA